MLLTNEQLFKRTQEKSRLKIILTQTYDQTQIKHNCHICAMTLIISYKYLLLTNGYSFKKTKEKKEVRNNTQGTILFRNWSDTWSNRIDMHIKHGQIWCIILNNST